jgi:methionyl-tRNA formyltransferase
MKKRSAIHFAFLGTSHIAVYVLEELKNAGLLPALIITPHDKPRGRGLESQETAVSAWAAENSVPTSHELEALKKDSWDVAVVVDYGIIIPKHVLELPTHGFLNVHPSLLPHLRGPSPIRSAILTDEKNTGVTVMVVDEKMDHGPILAQSEVQTAQWPPRLAELEQALMQKGGQLLAGVLPKWVEGEITLQEQDHSKATFTKIFKKEDGLLNLSDDAYQNLLKIRAFEGWPGTYAFFEQNKQRIRVKILDAHLENGKFIIGRVVPEGKRETSYEEFLRSGARPL